MGWAAASHRRVDHSMKEMPTIVIRFVIKEALALVKLLLSVMQQLSRSTIWHEIASLANVRRYQIFSSDDKTIATMLSEIGMFSVQMELARCSEKTWSHKFQGRGCESGCGWQSCSIEAIISNQYMDINISEVRLGSHFDVSFNVHQLHQLVLQSFLVISPSTECSIRNTLAICCYGQ